MSDTPVQPVQGSYRTETVVEVVDNTRQRRVLSAVIIVIILLLLAAGVFAWRMSTPVGAPSKGDLPEGVNWVRSIYGWGNSPSQLLNEVVDTAVGPDGTIWTVSSHNTLVAFRPNGSTKFVRQYQIGGKKGQVGSIEGIDVADNGEIYLVDFGLDKIQVVNERGDLLRSWDVPSPSEIAVQGDRVAVATWNGIAITDTNGKLIDTWGTRGQAKDQFDGPHGVAFDNDGNVYVSDTHNRRIKKYSPEGRLLWIVPKSQEQAIKAGNEGSRETSASIPYQIPSSMTFDSAGRLVLVDAFAFRMNVLDPKTGKITKTFGEFGNGDGFFAYPTGLDYDAARDYFVVADTANNRLQVIRVAGSGGNAALSRLRGLIDGPVWVCAIPLILLLLAVVLSVRSRRKKRAETVVPEAATE